LLNGGPAPSFFADFVAHYIVFGMNKVSVQNVTNPTMKEKLTKVNNQLDFIVVSYLKVVSTN